MKIIHALPAAALTFSLAFTGATAAAAAATSHNVGVQASEAAGVDQIQTLTPVDVSAINSDIKESGAADVKELPVGTVAFGLNESGDMVAVSAKGDETILESAETMQAEMVAFSSPGAVSGAAASGDKGVLSGAAKTIAGCAGGVIGYDQILAILERRASYWTVVKFLAKKIGPGLAVSCIAGAGGALATHMGW